MSKSQFRKSLKSALLISTMLEWSGVARAQQLGDQLPAIPYARTADSNAVDYVAGFSHWQLPSISIGNGDSSLSRTYQYNYDQDTDNFYGSFNTTPGINALYNVFSHPGGVDNFNDSVDSTSSCSMPQQFGFMSEGTCVHHGLTLSMESNLNVLTDRSGIQYTYDSTVNWIPSLTWDTPLARLTTIVKPSGEVIRMYFDNLTTTYDDPASVEDPNPYVAASDARIRAVVSSYGYMLIYKYYSNTPQSLYIEDYEKSDLFRLKSVTAVNLSVDYCDPTNVDACVLSHPWPTWTFNPSYDVAAGPTNNGYTIFGPYPYTVGGSQTDPLSETYAFTLNQLTLPSGRTITRNPMSSLHHETFNLTDGGGDDGAEEAEAAGCGDSDPGIGGSDTSTSAGDTSTDPGDACLDAGFPGDGAAGGSDPDDGGDDDLDGPTVGGDYTGDGMCIYADYRLCVVGQFAITNGQGTWNYNFNGDAPYQSMAITDPLGHTATVNTSLEASLGLGEDVTSVVDENGNTTSYQYDPTVGFLSQITYPEGNYTTYTYNDRGDVTAETDVPKPGSGLASRTIKRVYNGDIYCANPMTCNEPTATIDANGNETDYTYDPTTGFVLTQTEPADASGVRPQTRFTYTAMYPQVLNSAGQLVNTSAPIYKLTKTSTCQTATPANPASCVGSAAETVTTYAYNTNNLWLSSKTIAAGDSSVSATTSYAYDAMGNQIMADGPRTDVDDRSYATYDVLRRKVFEIGVDPDGSGPLPRVIVHHLYDVDGHEIRTETGTGNATDGSDFVVTSYKTMTYDFYGNLVQTVVAHP